MTGNSSLFTGFLHDAGLDPSLHLYCPQLVFMMDVEVDVSMLSDTVWSVGPERFLFPGDTSQDYGSAWRSTFFPSTLAPVIYGRSIQADSVETELAARLHSRRFNYDATEWFNQVVEEVEGPYLEQKDINNRPIHSFILERAELQLFDNQGRDKTFGQLAIYAQATTQHIGRIHDIYRILTRNKNEHSARRSLVPGGHLYDLLDSPSVRCSLDQGSTDVFQGISFYDNTSYLTDTEAKVYSLVHLRISESDCRKIIDRTAENNQLPQFSGTAWKVILRFLAVNRYLPDLITSVSDSQGTRNTIQTLSQGRHSLITRLGASFIVLNNSSPPNEKSEIFFLAEHVDAIMIARLHDQILRHAEVDLVIGMGNSTHHRTFEKISDGVLETYHQFTANSVRYWMDDVTANSGLGLTTLRSYKSAIDYQDRYNAMRVKIEDIATLAQQDKQKEISQEQEKAHQNQINITNKQQNTFLLLTIFSIIAMPWSMLNDGIDFVHRTTAGEFQWINSFWMLGFLALSLLVGVGIWLWRRIKTF